MIRRPFQRGDQIKVGDIEGTVHTQRGAKKPAPVKEPTPAEEARDPEAEKPKRGELNEGVEELPR